MEQEDGTVNTIKNLKDYRDVDYTIEEFEEELYKQFLALIPKDVSFDKNLLLKHVKDLYRARGTEKSIRFLLNALYRIETDFYYPKTDILRVSDGKWFVEKSLKITDVKRNGVPDSDPDTLLLFTNSRISGLSSNAGATVERVESFFENGVFVEELRVSSQVNDFEPGETIQTIVEENGEFYTITANIFSGFIASVTLTNSGTGYTVGDRPAIINTGANGQGAIIEVTAISNGAINSVGVIYSGAGFRANDGLLFTGSGSGANGYIISVLDDSSIHPNSYTIYTSTIEMEANTTIANAIYSNLITANANTTLANSLSSFVYGNTGPIVAIQVTTPGTDYSTTPTIDALANTMIRSLGILGRMDINNGGSGYQVGDKIEFLGGLGTGASGNVETVNGTGAITQVKFEVVPGNFVGGQGYSQSELPLANVITTTGTGANIAVTAILGDGETLRATTDSLGAIRRISVLEGGAGYVEAPLLDFSGIGNRDAEGYANVISGVYTYPGRYLNDDGHISGYNFLEDRDYYQLFSYVIRTNRSINDYRSVVNKLVHPAGTKLFGEFLMETPHMETEGETEFVSVTSDTYKFTTKTYNYSSNLIINFASHGLSVGNTVYLEFTSGNYASLEANSHYYVSNVVNTNAFTVNTSIANVSIGNVLVGLPV